MIGTVIWGAVALAGLGALAALGFWATAGKPLADDMVARVAANAPELRRQATALGGRPLWKFDLGLVVGMTVFLLGLATGGIALPVAAAGAFLALISLAGRLLVLGGRRRLDQIKEVTEP